MNPRRLYSADTSRQITAQNINVGTCADVDTIFENLPRTKELLMRTALVAIVLILLPAVHAATITGRLVANEDDRPLANISISFLANTDEADADPVWTGMSDADGRFTWEGAPNGNFRLIVNSDQWGVMLQRPEARPGPGPGRSAQIGFPHAFTHNGYHDFGDIALVPGGAVEVTVLDEWNREIPGSVHLRTEPERRSMLVFRGSSATIQGLGAGTAWIHFSVRSRTFWPAAKQVEIKHGTTTSVSIKIMERVDVNFRLRFSGAPAKPVTLRASPLEETNILNFAGNRGFRDSSMSGLKINWPIPATGEGTVQLARGRWFLDFRAEGFAPVFKEVDIRSREEVVEFAMSPETEATLTLSGPPTPVATYVLVREGAPSMDWIRKKFEEAGNMRDVQDTAGVVVGNWSGQFDAEVRLSPGRYWMAAFRRKERPRGEPPQTDSRGRIIEQYETMILGEVECPAVDKWSVTFEGETNSVTLTITHAGQVVPNQEIVLLWSGEDRVGRPTPWELRNRGGGIQATTGPDGVAVATGLRPGTHVVVTKMESNLRQLPRHVMTLDKREIGIEPGVNTASVDLEVVGGTLLNLKMSIDEGFTFDVRNIRNTVTRQCIVRYAELKPNDREPSEITFTLGHVPLGTYEVAFGTRPREANERNRQNPIIGRMQFTLAPGIETSVEHHISMHTVSGNYVFPRGSNQSSVSVRVRRVLGKETPTGFMGRVVRSDADGKFEIVGLPEGRYLVHVAAGRVLPAAWEVIDVADDVSNVRLTPPRTSGGTIEVKATSEDRFLRHNRFAVRLMDASTGETIEPFHFGEIIYDHEIQDVPPGNYTLEAWGDNLKTRQTQVRVRRDRTTTVEIELESAPRTQIEITLRELPDYHMRYVTWVPEDAAGNTLDAVLPGSAERGQIITLTELPPGCARIRIRILGFEDVVVELSGQGGERQAYDAIVRPR
jgi:hypothetical protein